MPLRLLYLIFNGYGGGGGLAEQQPFAVVKLVSWRDGSATPSAVVADRLRGLTEERGVPVRAFRVRPSRSRGRRRRRAARHRARLAPALQVHEVVDAEAACARGGERELARGENADPGPGAADG